VYYTDLAQRVRSQRDALPQVYGDFDFDRRPDRLATEPDADSALPAWVADREPILDDARVVELISTTTMLVNRLLDEVDGVELAGPVRWSTTPSLRGPVSLPIRARRAS